jgi:signal transduction histidine kinase
MAPSPRPELVPLSPARRVGYVAVTVVALVLDALTTIPEGEYRTEQDWTAFGFWETTVLQFFLVMTAAYSVLLLRRRFPLSVLAFMCALALVLTQAAPFSQPVAGVLISLYTAASLVESRWKGWLALALGLVTMTASMPLVLGGEYEDIELAILVMGGITFAVWLFGRREYTAYVTSSGLPGRLAEHGELSAVEERRRIARELHDILAHSVSAMMMQAAGAKAMTTALRVDHQDDLRLETVERALATIENTGSQSMRELNRLLSVMRGDDDTVETDTESSSQPGMTDVPRLVQLTRQSGLVVDVHVAGTPVRLDPSVGLAAYRMVQESLTNAMKHGGRGAVVDIFQNWQPDGLQLQVRSRSGHEGTQPGSLGGGSGLYGLHERVGLTGGTFESGWVGDEFVATAVLPLMPTVPPALDPGAVTNGNDRWPGPARSAVELHGRHGSRLDGSRVDGATRGDDWRIL